MIRLRRYSGVVFGLTLQIRGGTSVLGVGDGVGPDARGEYCCLIVQTLCREEATVSWCLYGARGNQVCGLKWF